MTTVSHCPPFPTASQTFPIKYYKLWYRENGWVLPFKVWSLDQQPAVPESLLELQYLGFIPDMLNQDLHFIKILRQDQLDNLLRPRAK